MRVELWVEGKLDAEILNALLAGNPAVRRRGSKTSLAPQVRTARSEPGNMLRPYYLRDRDFDTDPGAAPGLCVDATDDKSRILGWRWHRHEIENYLLEPAFTLASGLCAPEPYAAIVADAAAALAPYQAARWAIGMCRRELPPNYELQTKVEGNCEFALPVAAGLTEQGARTWLVERVGKFRSHVEKAIGPDAVLAQFDERLARFGTAEFLSAPAAVLTWYSGKDVLAFVADRLGLHAGDVRVTLADWVGRNPDEAEASWPEITELREALRREEARK